MASAASAPWSLGLPRRLPRRVSMLAARAGFTFTVGFVVVLALLLVSAAAVTGAVTRAAGAMPFAVDVPEDVAFRDLEERSVVYDRDGEVLAVLHDEHHRRHIPLEEIPEHVIHAVLAAEDRRFYEHGGYDPASIGRAFVANVRAQGVEQGGSTITQQLAKQNFVGTERTLQRKIEELAYAIALEREFSKDELIERYLNEVYFGNGAYGIAVAAQEYFRVDPAELAPQQAALLAALIRAPGALDPRDNPERAKERRDWVLAGMAEEGWLDPAEDRSLAQADLVVEPPLERTHQEPYVVEAVKRTFLDDPTFGADRQERIDRLFTGGLHIHTTIDRDLQAIAAEVVEHHIADLDGPTGALAAVHPPTGEVLALYGGADFEEQQFDLATQGRRQPGSAFKPFVLAAALEGGVPLGLEVEGNSGATFDARGWTAEDGGVRNFGDASYGRIALREALVRSVNTAFAQLIMVTGVEPVIGMADKLGIDVEQAFGEHDGPAIALGGVGSGATPLEMASAYGVFANAGQRAEPHLIDRVVDRAGNEVYVSKPDPQQVVDPEVNAAMVDIMRDVVSHGTGTRAQLPGWDVAGKTGTSQQAYDAWFAGITAPLATAVWIGHAEGQVAMPGMTGGGVPAQIWHDFMSQALDGRDPEPFPDADVDFSALERGADVDVPDVRGMSEGEAEQELTEAWLVPVVRQVAHAAPAGQVVWQSPGPGNRVPAGSSVVIGVSTGRPPEPEPDEPDDADDEEEEPEEEETEEPEEEEPEEPEEDRREEDDDGDNGDGNGDDDGDDGNGNGGGNGRGDGRGHGNGGRSGGAAA
jgi:penicillin-binding protein 1A